MGGGRVGGDDPSEMWAGRKGGFRMEASLRDWVWGNKDICMYFDCLKPYVSKSGFCPSTCSPSLVKSISGIDNYDYFVVLRTKARACAHETMNYH